MKLLFFSLLWVIVVLPIFAFLIFVLIVMSIFNKKKAKCVFIALDNYISNKASLIPYLHWEFMKLLKEVS